MGDRERAQEQRAACSVANLRQLFVTRSQLLELERVERKLISISPAGSTKPHVSVLRGALVRLKLDGKYVLRRVLNSYVEPEAKLLMLHLHDVGPRAVPISSVSSHNPLAAAEVGEEGLAEVQELAARLAWHNYHWTLEQAAEAVWRLKTALNWCAAGGFSGGADFAELAGDLFDQEGIQLVQASAERLFYEQTRQARELAIRLNPLELLPAEGQQQQQQLGQGATAELAAQPSLELPSPVSPPTACRMEEQRRPRPGSGSLPAAGAAGAVAGGAEQGGTAAKQGSGTVGGGDALEQQAPAVKAGGSPSQLQQQVWQQQGPQQQQPQTKDCDGPVQQQLQRRQPSLAAELLPAEATPGVPLFSDSSDDEERQEQQLPLFSISSDDKGRQEQKPLFSDSSDDEEAQQPQQGQQRQQGQLGQQQRRVQQENGRLRPAVSNPVPSKGRKELPQRTKSAPEAAAAAAPFRIPKRKPSGPSLPLSPRGVAAAAAGAAATPAEGSARQAVGAGAAAGGSRPGVAPPAGKASTGKGPVGKAAAAGGAQHTAGGSAAQQAAQRPSSCKTQQRQEKPKARPASAAAASKPPASGAQPQGQVKSSMGLAPPLLVPPPPPPPLKPQQQQAAAARAAMPMQQTPAATPAATLVQQHQHAAILAAPATFNAYTSAAPFCRAQAAVPFDSGQAAPPQAAAPFSCVQAASPFGSIQAAAPFNSGQAAAAPFSGGQAAPPSNSSQATAVPFRGSQAAPPFNSGQAAAAPFNSIQAAAPPFNSGQAAGAPFSGGQAAPPSNSSQATAVSFRGSQVAPPFNSGPAAAAPFNSGPAAAAPFSSGPAAAPPLPPPQDPRLQHAPSAVPSLAGASGSGPAVVLAQGPATGPAALAAAVLTAVPTAMMPAAVQAIAALSPPSPPFAVPKWDQQQQQPVCTELPNSAAMQPQACAEQAAAGLLKLPAEAAAPCPMQPPPPFSVHPAEPASSLGSRRAPDALASAAAGGGPSQSGAAAAAGAGSSKAAAAAAAAAGPPPPPASARGRTRSPSPASCRSHRSNKGSRSRSASPSRSCSSRKRQRHHSASSDRGARRRSSSAASPLPSRHSSRLQHPSSGSGATLFPQPPSWQPGPQGPAPVRDPILRWEWRVVFALERCPLHLLDLFRAEPLPPCMWSARVPPPVLFEEALRRRPLLVTLHPDGGVSGNPGAAAWLSYKEEVLRVLHESGYRLPLPDLLNRVPLMPGLHPSLEEELRFGALGAFERHLADVAVLVRGEAVPMVELRPFPPGAPGAPPLPSPCPHRQCPGGWNCRHSHVPCRECL